MAQEAVRESAAARDLRRLDEAGVLARHGLRAEIIAGELVIQGAPRPRHQDVVLAVGGWLRSWAQREGAYVAVGPIGVELDPEHSVRPDVVLVRAARVHLIAEDGLYCGPDLVVEVASPGTRSLDLVEKRAIYERLQVPEYWVVDLDRNEVLVFRLREASYEEPELRQGGDVLEPVAAPGLRASVDELLGGR